MYLGGVFCITGITGFTYLKDNYYHKYTVKVILVLEILVTIPSIIIAIRRQYPTEDISRSLNNSMALVGTEQGEPQLWDKLQEEVKVLFFLIFAKR